MCLFFNSFHLERVPVSWEMGGGEGGSAFWPGNGLASASAAAPYSRAGLPTPGGKNPGVSRRHSNRDLTKHRKSGRKSEKQHWSNLASSISEQWCFSQIWEVCIWHLGVCILCLVVCILNFWVSVCYQYFGCMYLSVSILVCNSNLVGRWEWDGEGWNARQLILLLLTIHLYLVAGI